MSGLGKVLPRVEALEKAQAVRDKAVRALEGLVSALGGRVEDVEASVSALSVAQEADGEKLDALEDRVRALEVQGRPVEPEPPPEPPIEPEPPVEPPAEPQEPEPEPEEPTPPDQPGIPLLGVGSASGSHLEHPSTPPITDGHVVDGEAELRRALADGKRRILIRGGILGLEDALNVTAPNTLVAPYGDERVTLNRMSKRVGSEQNAALRITGEGAHVLGIEITGVPERSDSPASSYAVLVKANGVRVERVEVHDGATGAICLYHCDDGVILDVATYACGGAGDGTNMPDGIVVPKGRLGRNHAIVRSFVGNAPDDGIDLYGALEALVWDCVVGGSGYGLDGRKLGDGSGVKAGGWDQGAGGNVVLGSLFVGNKLAGLNHNSTSGPRNTYENNTTAFNVRGVIADTRTLPLTRNNLSFGNPTYNETVAGDQERNSWNLRLGDPRCADPKNHDYSLLPGSPAIGAGVNGANLGASDVALALGKHWLNHPRVFIPRL